MLTWARTLVDNYSMAWQTKVNFWLSFSLSFYFIWLRVQLCTVIEAHTSSLRCASPASHRTSTVGDRVWYKNTTKVTCNGDLDRRPYR